MSKSSLNQIILTLFLVFTILQSFAQIKVICVGNGFTYGNNITNRNLNSYPAQLSFYLGKEYSVQNLGSLDTIDYRLTEEFQKSVLSNAQIIIIDIKPDFNRFSEANYTVKFKEELKGIINKYQTLYEKPEIILLSPLRNFNNSNIETALQQKFAPIYEELAYNSDLKIVNLHHIFGNEWSDHLIPDKKNISSIAAGKIAEKIYHTISNIENKRTDVIANFKLKPVSEFNFHGYKGYKFLNDGVEYFIVKPKSPANGNPWIWRARFWGHEPQTDVDLLERGFYLTYCDVSDLYGSDQAIATWDTFYKLATEAGLHKKAVLEGMSRGGLIVYNWAAKNPAQVAAIYADAPVMDFKSWPLGKGNSPGSKDDSQRLLKAYGFNNETEALNWKKNPIDHAQVMASAKIPMIHVVGDADEVVPVNENTQIFENRLNKLGAFIKVIHKKDIGHHPHSLNNPEPIVEFILKATGHFENRCVNAVPGNEFRSGAGWINGSDWHDVAQDIQHTLENKKVTLLLLGNSITQGFGGNRALINTKQGKDFMDMAMKGKSWETAGISGDKTQNLLWRLQNQNYNVAQPEFAAITIGINNVTPGDDPEDIAAGIIACAIEAKKQMPNTKIILFGLLPAGKEMNSSSRIACRKIHEILAKSNLSDIHYINLTSWFVNTDGSLKSELYAGDYLHLSSEGYKIWSSKIADLINQF